MRDLAGEWDVTQILVDGKPRRIGDSRGRKTQGELPGFELPTIPDLDEALLTLDVCERDLVVAKRNRDSARESLSLLLSEHQLEHYVCVDGERRLQVVKQKREKLLIESWRVEPTRHEEDGRP